MTQELVGSMLLSTTFTLPRPTTGYWLGLNPYMRPIPWPLYASRTFPDGQYELGFDGDTARWRYRGPHFSKEGRYEDQGNQIVPVGFEGPYCFIGHWMPGGISLRPSAVGLTESPEWLARQRAYAAREEALYREAADHVRNGRVGPLLRWMLKAHVLK